MINACIGETYFIKEVLFNLLNISKDICKINYEYPDVNGFAPLVKLLEDKHQAPVIITNGAKHGLSVAFHRLANRGKRTYNLRSPYWSHLPSLAALFGLKRSEDDFDFILSVLPNNPCGFMLENEYIQNLHNAAKELKKPFIHDAAYYCHIYLDDKYKLEPIGDLQIFSISKSYGLSGLRIGYIVCNDTSYYNQIKEYIDATNVGVSIVSQEIVFDILNALQDKELNSKFIKECRNKLKINKELCSNIDKSILEIPVDLLDIPTMFLWAKILKPNIFEKAGINVALGEGFGDSSKIRMNLGLNVDVLKSVIEKLNAAA